MENNATRKRTNVLREGSLDSVQQEISKAGALMRKLDSLFKQVPTLTGKDDPQCSSAEDLYAQKREAEEELAKHLNYLSSFQDTIQNFIAEQKDKLESLTIDKTRLKHENPINKYSYSIYLQENKILEARTIQKEFVMAMNSGHKTIELAKSKKFPGGTPKRKPPVYPIGPFSSGPNASSPIMSETSDHKSAKQAISPHENHINNLVSIGPLGK